MATSTMQPRSQQWQLLMSFRRPEVTVGTPGSPQAFVIHPPGEREPLALSLHHLPMPVTFALFEVSSQLVWRVWVHISGFRSLCRPCTAKVEEVISGRPPGLVGLPAGADTKT